MDFLALIINSRDNKEVAEYRVTALSAYFAKTEAEKLFTHEQKYQPKLRKVETWRAEVVAL